MKHCCENKGAELVALRAKQSKVLRIVLAINASMFLVELTAGLLSRSTALLGDSLDMFGDAMVYAFSLYVLNKSEQWRSSAALSKGVIMALFGVGVMAEAVYKSVNDIHPVASTMGAMGTLALAANLVCLMLLLRHRTDDLNMRSTWVCSRNDIVANTGVLVAAALVAATSSKWPDIAVGMVIALLFLTTAFSVMRESVQALRSGS